MYIFLENTINHLQFLPNMHIKQNLQLLSKVISDCLLTSSTRVFKKNFRNLTSERKKSRKVWCVADTLDNTGNEALAESDNYFN